jgi:hypothetical protein
MRRALALVLLALVVHLTALTGLSRCAPSVASRSASMDMAGMMHGQHGTTDPSGTSQPERCPTIAACALAMAPIAVVERAEATLKPASAPIVPASLVASWIAAPETPPPRG